MESADEVSTKMKMMYQHMENRASEISNGGKYTATVGTLTPTARFTKDDRVPRATRYCIPDIIVNLSFNPSQEEQAAYAKWAMSMKEEKNNMSQKSQASDETNS
jgi:hypothetical protein